MSTKSLLISLFGYKASVDRELLDAMIPYVDGDAAARVKSAVRVLNHAHIVDRIFMAHLQKKEHAYEASWTKQVPTLSDLATAVGEIDQWYIDYLAEVTLEALEEDVIFTFTDGNRGRMSRQEMLAHVATHSGYHRGEVGRLLPEIESTAMRDVFAGYLHRSEPQRRQ